MSLIHPAIAAATLTVWSFAAEVAMAVPIARYETSLSIFVLDILAPTEPGGTSFGPTTRPFVQVDTSQLGDVEDFYPTFDGSYSVELFRSGASVTISDELAAPPQGGSERQIAGVTAGVDLTNRSDDMRRVLLSASYLSHTEVIEDRLDPTSFAYAVSDLTFQKTSDIRPLLGEILESGGTLSPGTSRSLEQQSDIFYTVDVNPGETESLFAMAGGFLSVSVAGPGTDVAPVPLPGSLSFVIVGLGLVFGIRALSSL